MTAVSESLSGSELPVQPRLFVVAEEAPAQTPEEILDAQAQEAIELVIALNELQIRLNSLPQGAIILGTSQIIERHHQEIFNSKSATTPSAIKLEGLKDNMMGLLTEKQRNDAVFAYMERNRGQSS
jgi:Mg2+/Co2+ transporter CorC